MDLKEKTVAALKKHDSGKEVLRLPAALPGASVLIPLLLRDGQLRLLLTVRAIHVRNLRLSMSYCLDVNCMYSMRMY